MTLFDPDDSEPVELVDLEHMQQLATELTIALDERAGWERRDADSFVSAGHRDGTATIVGNSGGWSLMRPGPGDSQVAQPMPSAQAAFEAVGL